MTQKLEYRLLNDMTAKDIHSLFHPKWTEHGEQEILTLDSIPKWQEEDFARLLELSDAERFAAFCALFLPDLDQYHLRELAAAFFQRTERSPLCFTLLNIYEKSRQMLELWHGSTGSESDLWTGLSLVLREAYRRSYPEHCFEDEKGRIPYWLNLPEKDMLAAFVEAEHYDAYRVAGVIPAHLKNIARKQLLLDLLPADASLFLATKAEAKLVPDARVQTLGQGDLLAPLMVLFCYLWLYLERLKDEDLGSSPFVIVLPSHSVRFTLAAFWAKSWGIPIERVLIFSEERNALTGLISQGHWNAHLKTEGENFALQNRADIVRLLAFVTSKEEQQDVLKAFEAKEKIQLSKETKRKIQAFCKVSEVGSKQIQRTLIALYDQFDQMCAKETALAFDAAEHSWLARTDIDYVVLANDSPLLDAPLLKSALDLKCAKVSACELIELLSQEGGVECYPSYRRAPQKPVWIDTLTEISFEQIKEALLTGRDYVNPTPHTEKTKKSKGKSRSNEATRAPEQVEVAQAEATQAEMTQVDLEKQADLQTVAQASDLEETLSEDPREKQEEAPPKTKAETLRQDQASSEIETVHSEYDLADTAPSPRSDQA